MNENKKIKVLIIEDDSYISDMYRIKFESENFETNIAKNGTKGIEFLEKEIPNIILLDIVMPQIDGFSVLKIIKKDKRLEKVPVILLTNLSQRENIERGFDLGADGYIIKAHFTPLEVVKKIKETLKISI